MCCLHKVPKLRHAPKLRLSPANGSSLESFSAWCPLTGHTCFQLQVCLSMRDLLVDTIHKRLSSETQPRLRSFHIVNTQNKLSNS